MKSASEVVSTVPLNMLPTSVCAAFTVVAVMVRAAAAGSNAAKKTAGSLPKARAATISVSGVMLAIAELPLPVTTVCNLEP